MKRIYEWTNNFNAFFAFLGVVVGVCVLMGGLGFWSAFFTGIVIYTILRILFAFWKLLLKILGVLGVRYEHRE